DGGAVLTGEVDDNSVALLEVDCRAEPGRFFFILAPVDGGFHGQVMGEGGLPRAAGGADDGDRSLGNPAIHDKVKPHMGFRVQMAYAGGVKQLDVARAEIEEFQVVLNIR